VHTVSDSRDGGHTARQQPLAGAGGRPQDSQTRQATYTHEPDNGAGRLLRPRRERPRHAMEG